MVQEVLAAPEVQKVQEAQSTPERRFRRRHHRRTRKARASASAMPTYRASGSLECSRLRYCCGSRNLASPRAAESIERAPRSQITRKSEWSRRRRREACVAYTRRLQAEVNS